MQGRSNRCFSAWRQAALAVVGGAALLAAAPSPAEEPAEPVPSVDSIPLDRLLRLPNGTGQGTALERRGGNTKGEWESRFRQAREAESEARTAIAKTRTAIEEKVAKEGGGQWRMGAPGLIDIDNQSESGADSPFDYQLTQTLRRNRAELARAERALQDLQVEANLASVPAEWRSLPAEDIASPR